MPNAELVFANVLDRRYYEAEGEAGQPLVFTISLPGRALPFVVVRQWKAPQGFSTEHFELVAPSGRVSYTSPRVPRRFPGQMDLASVTQVVEDGTLQEEGVHLASFFLNGRLEGQTEFQVFLTAAAASLPKDIEDALKKSDVIWVGVEANGRDRAAPVWFAYRQGRIYVLHGSDAASGEQYVPGLPEATEVVVVTRRKGRDTRSDRFHAAVRLIEPADPEFGELAAVLADRRRDRHGPPQDAINRWQRSCLIAELVPSIPD
ncbi:MAG: hypothetical protein M3245_00890 [Actinomycetota bacterium]|nr:hypothetical protein [Actinomycetota bacterium]